MCTDIHSQRDGQARDRHVPERVQRIRQGMRKVEEDKTSRNLRGETTTEERRRRVGP